MLLLQIRVIEMDKNTKNALEQITCIATELGFKFNVSLAAERSRIDLTRAHTTLHVGIQKSRLLYLYLYLKACEEGGRRTDLNDCESVLLAAFLRAHPLGISCSLWDEPHPILDAPNEIYARVMTFAQFPTPSYDVDSSLIEQVGHILVALRDFERIFPHYLDHTPTEHNDEEQDFSYEAADEWAAEISSTLDLSGGQPLDVKPFRHYYTWSNTRLNPTWKYFRNIKRGISVFQSPKLSAFIRQATLQASWDTIDGINGKMFISEGTKNIITFASIRLLKNALSKFNKKSVGEFAIIPVENFIVASKGEYVVFLNRDCGRKRFEQERVRIGKRHVKEANLLFAVSELEWKDKIDDEEFELMILDLIKREEGVAWARKVSASKERDGGKDLVAEWVTPPLPRKVVRKNQNPFTARRVIIQCKVSKRSVGKSKVIDIRDTIESHNAKGYFLAVSSDLATGLTDHLLKLKDEGRFWVDWWTRPEIEEKLKKWPDVVAKYPSIVSTKH
jgi:hypothetical protein